MARKTTVERAAAAAAKAAVAATESVDLDDEDEIPEEEDFLNALREMDQGGEVEWAVSKISGLPDERGFIEKLTSAQLQLQYFRDTYGPGEYRVVGRKNGIYFKGGHKQIKISKVGYTPPAGSARAGAASGDSTKDLLAVLDKRSADRAAELKSWAQILVPVMAPLVLKMFERTSVTDMVSGLAALKGLVPEPKKPEGLEEQLDRVVAVMERVEGLRGKSEPSTGATWLDLVRDGLGSVKELIAARAAGGGGMLPTMMAPPSLPHVQPPGPAAPASPSTAGESSTVAPPSGAPTRGNGVGVISMLPWLRATLETLIVQAARDRDPDLYAQVVVDNIPEGINVKDFKTFIARPDWWQQLAGFDQRVTPYQGWFKAFRDGVLEYLEDEAPEPPADPPGPRPDDGDGDI